MTKEEKHLICCELIFNSLFICWRNNCSDRKFKRSGENSKEIFHFTQRNLFFFQLIDSTDEIMRWYHDGFFQILNKRKGWKISNKWPCIRKTSFIYAGFASVNSAVRSGFRRILNSPAPVTCCDLFDSEFLFQANYQEVNNWKEKKHKTEEENREKENTKWLFKVFWKRNSKMSYSAKDSFFDVPLRHVLNAAWIKPSHVLQYDWKIAVAPLNLRIVCLF